jgi:putative hydrolase of the HAD superfamily
MSLRVGGVDELRGPAAQAQRQDAGVSRVFRGVITNWGGVMTSPIRDAVQAWLDSEDIERDTYAAIMGLWVVTAYDPAADGNPVHALERGEITSGEFERLLAARLVRRDGEPVLAEGLLARMFATSAPCEPMYAAIASLHTAGLRTCLLSNSWGSDGYPREVFGRMYQEVVISAEVGMRKPEERIFRHAADLIGLAPGECVFIDDMEANVRAAEALGMHGVLHTQPEATVQALGELFGMSLG